MASNHIPSPRKVEIEKGASKTQATIIIEPCYPGYGTTLGNTLRRVLLSSMPGAAITSAKIKGVSHEFSTLPGVKEDIVELMLNLKLIRVKLHDDEPTTITLSMHGEKKVTAGDITVPSSVEITNSDQHIATLTDKSSVLEMELVVQKGMGYVPSELQNKENREIGSIQLDAVYSPIKNVNFEVTHVRVGEITNFDALRLTISTDGTMSPEDAFTSASSILVDHYQVFSSAFIQKKKSAAKKTR